MHSVSVDIARNDYGNYKRLVPTRATTKKKSLFLCPFVSYEWCHSAREVYKCRGQVEVTSSFHPLLYPTSHYRATDRLYRVMSAKGNLDAYHLEQSEADLAKVCFLWRESCRILTIAQVGLTRFDAQYDVPQTLDLCLGDVLGHFTSPFFLSYDPSMHLAPTPPFPFIPTLPAMKQGIYHHSATPAGTETQERSLDATTSSGTSVYSTWSVEAPWTHFDPERGPSQSQSLAQVDQHTSAAPQVAPNQVSDVDQRWKLWCLICDKGFHAPKALTRHNDDCHSSPRSCKYPDCNFIYIGSRKLQKHLQHAHAHLPPPSRRRTHPYARNETLRSAHDTDPSCPSVPWPVPLTRSTRYPPRPRAA